MRLNIWRLCFCGCCCFVCGFIPALKPSVIPLTRVTHTKGGRDKKREEERKEKKEKDTISFFLSMLPKDFGWEILVDHFNVDLVP